MSLKGFGLFATVVGLGFSVGAYAQDAGDIFAIDLRQEVVVGDMILPAGKWDIRWTGNSSSPTIKIYRNGVKNVEVATKSVPSEGNKKHEATEGVIERLGSNYYLTRIWIEGERTDYQIQLPARTTTLARGDSQRVGATFHSASRFAKGALPEAQARTHQGVGLGDLDDQDATGVTIARAYRGEATPSPSPAPAVRETPANAAVPDARLQQELAAANQREAAARASAAEAAERVRVLERELAERTRLDAERAAQRAADDARAKAERDRLDAERAAQRTADDARAQAERARLDAERAAQRAADDARAQAERTRLDADRAARNKEAMDAAVEQARKAAAEQAEREKQELRRQLVSQLSSVLDTKDTTRGLVVNMSNVTFDTGKSVISANARERLAKLSGVVLAYPNLTLQVEGHTDNVGVDKDNQKLSEDRAKSVSDFLTAQGVAAGSISSRGMGKTQPVATNDTEAGRQQNRRVEIVVSGSAIGVSGPVVIAPK